MRIFRQFADFHLVVGGHLVDIGDVIEVENGAQLMRLGKFAGRHVVGAEHDTALCADFFGHEQLAVRSAVQPEAFIDDDFQNARIGQRLDSKILFEAFVPRKSFV